MYVFKSYIIYEKKPIKTKNTFRPKNHKLTIKLKLNPNPKLPTSIADLIV
jgi:hypothetical protein